MATASMKQRPMLDHALEALSFGYPVFPVCSPLMGNHEHWNPEHKRMEPCPHDRWGKIPLESWRAYQTRLPTVAEVREHWRKWPLANIGMATGRLSGIVVLDCDSGEARALAMGNGGLDETPTVWTGKPGGIHYWLKHPGIEVRNFVAGRKQRYPGLDFRGDGGYVLLPPSVHRNQNAKYKWNPNTAGMTPSEVPPWLMALLTGDGETGDADSEHAPLDLGAILSGIGEGSRDDTLYRYAAKMRGDDVPLAYAEQMIRQAARLCKPAFDEDVAVEKVRRAYREFKPNGDFSALLEDGVVEPSALQDVEAEAAPNRVWPVYNAEDFLAIEFPAVVWRIEGYMRERAILFSYGPPGAIKTFVATDAGLAIASGGLFLNKFVCQQGRVLVVQEDTLASDYQQAYLRPMMAARGITGADVRDTLFIAPQDDFALDQNERLSDLCAWLETYKPDLVILDSFYLMYSGKKEDLLQVMKILKKIRNKYGCAIWIIDHNRKGQGDVSGENPIDRLINGREKSAAVDVVMESRPIKGEQGSTFLDVLKLRGSKLPEPVRVTYADGRITVDGEEEETLTGAKQTVYEWLCREGGSRTKAQISKGVDLSLRSIDGALAELWRDGLAQKNGKSGRADTWIALRQGDADPVPDVFYFEDDNA